MSDVDLSEFEALNGRTRQPCPIGAALAELKGKEREQFAAALDSPTITCGGVSRWMAKRNMKASINHVSVHRRGSCTCS